MSEPPPIPPPMPVIPVDPGYAHPLPEAVGQARPRFITTLGVLSIILAIVQGIAAFGWAAFALTAIVTAQVQQQQAAMMNVAALTVAPVEDERPGGLPESAAAAAGEGLTRHHPLDAARKQHLQTLLERQGREILPFPVDSTLTAGRVAAQVSDAGPMGPGGDYYEVGRGRIEVTDRQAVFRRNDGQVFRSTDAVVDRALTEDQINTALVQVEWAADTAPSDTQAQALRARLRDPTQTVLRAGEVVSMGGSLEDGTVWFLSSAGQVRVDSAGKIEVLQGGAPIPGTVGLGGQPVSTFWAGFTMLDAAVTGILAVPLLIAGILLLRGRPSGWRLHLWWAWLKIPLALLGSLVCGLAVREWLTSLPQAAPMGSVTPSAAGWIAGVATALAGAGYAVILLVLLSRRKVREYFQKVI